ncbi:protein kinase [Lysinibacillus capsici]|uniref:protein kinase n=1 Tax=Lysinibacillus capsici TaxID=2115968 RepID=UPI002E21E5DD|nr:protein kinase [Lysinibacillus capsici]
MLTQDKYDQILNFFDNNFWDTKATESNWYYEGIILDWYFDSSVLSIDFLDVEEFFYENGGFNFVDNKLFVEQFKNVENDKKLKLLENVLNILKHSKVNEENCQLILNKVSNVLMRYNIKIINPEFGYLELISSKILDFGSYCNIIHVKEGVLRKELIPIHRNDENLKRRLKYEFENMKKLSSCPQILNVFSYDEENNTYLMEQAEVNLYDFLNSQISLKFELKLKIAMDILKGMEFAHKNEIIHRDLHLGNVLKINNDFVVCDFGLSKDLSIDRSIKSSATEKNNHIFVDPTALSDFTKLDKKSDIYSIGKIIDYIFLHNGDSQNHIFKTIVERCITRDRDLRYSSCTEIINEMKELLENKNQEETRNNIIEKIKNSQYDSQVHDFLMELNSNQRLPNYIVDHNLSNFGQLLLKFEYSYQIVLIKTIENGYAAATGYNGWQNYDIFARISHYLCINAKDMQIKKVAKDMLEGCANIRYFARNLLESIQD